jgi:hypothetical protein
MIAGIAIRKDASAESLNSGSSFLLKLKLRKAGFTHIQTGNHAKRKGSQKRKTISFTGIK